MNLASAFAASAERNARKTAIFWGDQEHHFGSLHAQAVRLGATLQDRFGVRPGDRVGLWLKNCPEFVPALFGVFHAGAVVVPINNFLKPDEIGFILADADIDVLITDASMAEHQPALLALRPKLRFWQVEEFTNPESRTAALAATATRNPEPGTRNEEDLALIIYTSGTTGRPKGAMLTHGNLLHNVESCRQVLQAVDHDRFVVLLPMFHSFMLTVGVLLPLLVGGTIVLIRSLHPAKAVLHEILSRQATIQISTSVKPALREVLIFILFVLSVYSAA